MYLVILERVDAVSAKLGLLREEARVRKGVNPWSYAGGSSSSVTVRDFEMQEKQRLSSESRASTLVGKEGKRDLEKC